MACEQIWILCEHILIKIKSLIKMIWIFYGDTTEFHLKIKQNLINFWLKSQYDDRCRMVRFEMI